MKQNDLKEIEEEIEIEGETEVKSPSDIIKYECLKAKKQGYLQARLNSINSELEFLNLFLKTGWGDKEIIEERISKLNKEKQEIENG